MISTCWRQTAIRTDSDSRIVHLSNCHKPALSCKRQDEARCSGYTQYNCDIDHAVNVSDSSHVSLFLKAKDHWQGRCVSVGTSSSSHLDKFLTERSRSAPSAVAVICDSGICEYTVVRTFVFCCCMSFAYLTLELKEAGLSLESSGYERVPRSRDTRVLTRMKSSKTSKSAYRCLRALPQDREAHRLASSTGIRYHLVTPFSAPAPPLTSLSYTTIPMADPIGIFTSALDVVSKIYDIVKTIKDAPETIKRLERESSKVKGLLSKLFPPGSSPYAMLARADMEDPEMAALVEDAGELTTAVETFLKKATEQKDDGSRKIRKLLWPFRASEADELSDKFKAFYPCLAAMFAVSTSYVPKHFSVRTRAHSTKARKWTSCTQTWTP